MDVPHVQAGSLSQHGECEFVEVFGVDRASFTDTEKEEKADSRRERLAVAAGMRYSIVFAKRLCPMQHLTIRNFWWSIRI